MVPQPPRSTGSKPASRTSSAPMLFAPRSCVTVTLLDGLVLARSTFHHSMNYRSVVILGGAARVEDPALKRAALDRIAKHVVPRRTSDARPANDKELRATLVMSLPIEEASVKVRTGGPIDNDEDMDMPVWAGVVPLAMVPGPPIPDPALPASIRSPDYVTTYHRRNSERPIVHNDEVTPSV